MFNYILKNHSWSYIEKSKKHRCIEHCKNLIKYHLLYEKKWKNISGIYKITYLPQRIFTYYGSSRNVGSRVKYHFYNGKKQKNFLGLFLNAFTWSSFSITLIEECDINTLKTREDWYLNKFKPLLNFMTRSYTDSRKIYVKSMSPLTKKKISDSLKGRFHTLETREKMSRSKSGRNNIYYGKRLHPLTLLAAQKVRGKLVYVYSSKNKSLVNNSPFVSIRETAKYLPISPVTLVKKLDTGKRFKGYYYYSYPLGKNNMD